MINTKLTRKAMRIAYDAHKDQLDKSSVPYIYHPIHVAEQMDTELECIVALLHDVVEDTKVTFADLQKEFSDEVIQLLKLLTRDKKIEYMDYIKKIKIADIKHNSDETRLDMVTKEDIERRKKYKEALEYLETI